MSLAILVRATATPRSPLDASARAPWPPWWTIGLAVVRRSNSGLRGERRDDLVGESVGSVDPRADRGAAERQLAECDEVGDRTGERPLEQARPGVGLLADGHRRGVHQMGASGLDGVAIVRSLSVAQRVDEPFEAGWVCRSARR